MRTAGEKTVPLELPNFTKLEWTGVFVICMVTLTEIFATVAPYFGLHPEGDQSALSQQSTIMQNVFISCVSFLIGASVGTRRKDDSIAMQASTAAKLADTAAVVASAAQSTTTHPPTENP